MSAENGTIWRFYNRHQISFRKSLFASEQECGDVALARWLWKRGQKQIDPKRLVFIDEMGAATDMVRRRGWRRRGERLIGYAPVLSLEDNDLRCSATL